MEPDRIAITGARQHNLKNVNVDVPKKKLVGLTGVSGSVPVDGGPEVEVSPGPIWWPTFAVTRSGLYYVPNDEPIGGLTSKIDSWTSSPAGRPRCTALTSP